VPEPTIASMTATGSVAVVAAAGDVDRLPSAEGLGGRASGICEPSRPAEGGEHSAPVFRLSAPVGLGTF
jgi:hypothetical protein